MNTGAFGENFPYSNCHDLNMDWIIKITKDFLDQYTNIQQTITDGLEGLDNKARELETLLQQWYDTHSEDIANQLATALQEINNELSQSIIDFTNEANIKAQQAMESIPSDYSQLSSEVVDLRKAIDYIPYALHYNEFVFSGKLSGETTQTTLWFNDFIPASQYPYGLYAILYDAYGRDGTQTSIAEIRVRYSDNTSKTTAITEIGKITPIEIDNSKEVTGFDFIGFRSTTISQTAISCSWSISLFTGEALEKIITQQNFDGMFQIGAFNSRNMRWVASTKGIVMRQASPLYLNSGDKIYLTNYSGIHYRAMYLRSGETSREITNWLSNTPYTVTYNGLYWIEIETNPLTDVANIHDLTNRLRVVKYKDYFDIIKESEEVNQKTDWNVKSINHRGMNLIAPENTLPAFVLSSKLGWKYVETDVASTSDGVIVLLHDETINRTARNSDGSTISTPININDITYEQALDYDFGIWKGTEYAGTKIPTLDQFLILCRNLSLKPYIDFGSITDNEIIRKTIFSIKRLGMIKHTTVVGININTLRLVKSLSEHIRIGWLTTPSTSAIETIAELKTATNEVFIDAQTDTYDTLILDELAEADIPLETYTPNNQNTLADIDPYVSGITSDYLVAGQVLYKKSMGIPLA